MSTYTRVIEGKTETMIPIAPDEAVNLKSAIRLGLVAKPAARGEAVTL
jgi:hypothetical protein